MYRTILFDFDGTLVPSLDYWLEGFKHAFGKLGQNHPESVIVERCFYKEEAEIAASFGLESVREFWALVQEGLHAAYSEPTLFPGVEEVLSHCQELEIAVGIVTSNERAFVHRALVHLGVDHHFPVMVTADDITNFKPHPEPVLKALEQLSAEPSRTLFVGDYVVDVKAGKAAGTRTAVFFNDSHDRFHSREHLEDSEPDFIFSSYADLLRHLRSSS